VIMWLLVLIYVLLNLVDSTTKCNFESGKRGKLR